MASGAPTRPPAELIEALSAIQARYAPECLSSCEMAYFCRREARNSGSLEALGRTAKDDLGGIESVGTVINLSTGAGVPSTDQVEIAERLRRLRILYDEEVA